MIRKEGCIDRTTAAEAVTGYTSHVWQRQTIISRRVVQSLLTHIRISCRADADSLRVSSMWICVYEAPLMHVCQDAFAAAFAHKLQSSGGPMYTARMRQGHMSPCAWGPSWISMVACIWTTTSIFPVMHALSNIQTLFYGCYASSFRMI